MRRIEATPHEPTDGSAALAALEEYAVEASIAKVAGSEALDYVLDENIQIHGGNGFVQDYPAERHYRDARVNRIFEGTNEINRLLIPGMLARRAVKGDLPLIPAAKALQDELLGRRRMRRQWTRRCSPTSAARSSRVQESGADGARPGDADLRTEADRPAGSADARGRHPDRTCSPPKAPSLRAPGRGGGAGRQASLHADAARVFVNDAAMRIDASARQALAATVDGDTLRTMLAALRRVLKVTPVNTVTMRRRLADETRGARRISVRTMTDRSGRAVGRVGQVGRAGESAPAAHAEREPVKLE